MFWTIVQQGNIHATLMLRQCGANVAFGALSSTINHVIGDNNNNNDDNDNNDDNNNNNNNDYDNGNEDDKTMTTRMTTIVAKMRVRPIGGLYVVDRFLNKTRVGTPWVNHSRKSTPAMTIMMMMMTTTTTTTTTTETIRMTTIMTMTKTLEKTTTRRRETVGM